MGAHGQDPNYLGPQGPGTIPPGNQGQVHAQPHPYPSHANYSNQYSGATNYNPGAQAYAGG